MNTEPSSNSSDDATAVDLTEQQIETAEAHRGFVREMHEKLGRAYGFGGAVVLAVMAGVVVTAGAMGWWAEAMLWVPGITAVLASIYLVRNRIYSHRDDLRERVEEYCRVNDIDPDVLCDYYDSEQMYSFFSAIFETPPSADGT